MLNTLLDTLLASRSFPMKKFPMGSKFYFSLLKLYFSPFIFTDKYLKFKEIEYQNHYVNSEM